MKELILSGCIGLIAGVLLCFFGMLRFMDKYEKGTDKENDYDLTWEKEHDVRISEADIMEMAK